MVKAICTLFFVFICFGSLSAQSIDEVKGLSVGAKAPDFNAKDQNGKKVSLKEQLKKGPVVLIFYRGQWCPFCNRILKKVEDSLQLIKDKGASVVTISPETSEAIKQTISKTNATYSIISDNGLKIMRSYDVAFKVDDNTVTKYKGYGVDFDKSNGKNGAYLPVPATYIIGKDGIVKYVYFNKDYRERSNVQDILNNL
ncbi:MAG TPA: peroxiredoxin-like family protein [Chitinophagaceae bacterium]|nr:peroxiredoxin-like family protein [Chitinophagaceae bacterium]